MSRDLEITPKLTNFVPPPAEAIAMPVDQLALRPPPVGSALSRELPEGRKLAEKHPDDGPANLERVSVFYEIERPCK